MKRIKVVKGLKSQVYRNIKDGILSRTLLPGTQLKESELVQKLGVSRTPIREALSQLSQEGVIEIFPNKGAFVKSWEKEEVIEVLHIREVLEGLSAKLATRHLTNEIIDQFESYFNDYREDKISYEQADQTFHTGIIEAARSIRLHELIINSQDNLQMMDMRKVSFKSPRRIRESLREHQDIIDSFRIGNEDKAEYRTRIHFQNIRAYYQKHLDLIK